MTTVMISDNIHIFSNNLSKDGMIFFPDFCDIVLKRFREEDEEELAKTMFKVMLLIVLLILLS